MQKESIITPPVYKVEPAESITFQCDIVNAKWYYQGFNEEIISFLNYEGRDFHLNEVSKNNAGYYYCYISNETTGVIFKAHLFVFGKFTVNVIILIVYMLCESAVY